MQYTAPLSAHPFRETIPSAHTISGSCLSMESTTSEINPYAVRHKRSSDSLFLSTGGSVSSIPCFLRADCVLSKSAFASFRRACSELLISSEVTRITPPIAKMAIGIPIRNTPKIRSPCLVVFLFSCACFFCVVGSAI